MFSFAIPIPIQSKKNSRPIYTNAKTGKPFLGKSKKFKDFEKELLFFLTAGKNTQGIRQPITTPVALEITMQFKSIRRIDLDNALAALFDGLQQAKIIANDRQIVELRRVQIQEKAGQDFTMIQLFPY